MGDRVDGLDGEKRGGKDVEGGGGGCNGEGEEGMRKRRRR